MTSSVLRNCDMPGWVDLHIKSKCPNCGYEDEIGYFPSEVHHHFPKEGDKITCNDCGYIATIVPDGVK